MADAQTSLFRFRSPDPDEVRGLHAKCTLVESDEWLAAMVGSSNTTSLGLGLLTTVGHHELNLWIGCAAGSKEAKQMGALTCTGDRVDLDAITWESTADEDDVAGPTLPLGFEDCIVEPGKPHRARLRLAENSLPASWAVTDPAGHPLLNDAIWVQDRPSEVTVELEGPDLPAFLVVQWDDGALASSEATWTVNVSDRGALPAPADLANLPLEIVLAALASSRPLPVALEAELRRREARGGAVDRDDLDPLKPFDSTGLLLQRARQVSVSLWGLAQRLERPLSSTEALEWRLRGGLGPIAIADGLVTAAEKGMVLAGEAHFLLAELALTVGAVDWAVCAQRLDRATVRALVRSVLDDLEGHVSQLGDLAEPALADYVADAFAEARR